MKLLQTPDEYYNRDRLFERNIKEPCAKHKPHGLGYIAWMYYAEQKLRYGAKQKQCPDCGRWYFKNEMD